jgi:hypothetical protein
MVARLVIYVGTLISARSAPLEVSMVVPLPLSIRERIGEMPLQDPGPHRRGSRTYEDSARIFADTLPLYAMPISVKDLFDVKGETTLAVSRVLVGAPPPDRDSEVVRRLRHAGAIIIGKTNMTEFAFSGLGITR